MNSVSKTIRTSHHIVKSVILSFSPLFATDMVEGVKQPIDFFFFFRSLTKFTEIKKVMIFQPHTWYICI